MSEIVLTGLDGANPLGFLAGLGVLEALTARRLPARLAWRDVAGWRPVVTGVDADLKQLIGWLDADRVACTDEPALALAYDGKQDLKPPPDQFRFYLEEQLEGASPERRRGVDWVAGFGSDVVQDNNGNTKPTALHFAAGQQQFLKMVNDLAEGVNADDLREALVGPWRYERQLPVMGWDATASRDYALRAGDPSKDKKAGVPGADWLAVRGLGSVPVAPVGTRLKTTGCVGGWKTGSFRWGLWTVPLDLAMTRSAMRLDVVDMDASERSARGIGAVLSCGIKRSDQGGYGSFEPAMVS